MSRIIFFVRWKCRKRKKLDINRAKEREKEGSDSREERDVGEEDGDVERHESKRIEVEKIVEMEKAMQKVYFSNSFQYTKVSKSKTRYKKMSSAKKRHMPNKGTTKKDDCNDNEKRNWNENFVSNKEKNSATNSLTEPSKESFDSPMNIFPFSYFYWSCWY